MLKSIDVLTTAWNWLRGDSVDIRRLSEALCRDCGVDASGLSSLDFADALHERDSSRWYDIGFACTACMATYRASGECSPDEFLRGIAATCLVANAIQRGHGDIEFVLDNCLIFLAQNMSLGNVEVRKQVMGFLLNRAKDSLRAD